MIKCNLIGARKGEVCYDCSTKQEHDLSLFAAKVETEVEIDFLLWKLLNGISYVEGGH
jgi:hypothetical protein